MGQKTNPELLQLGTKSFWKTEFKEKTSRDLGFTHNFETQLLNFLTDYLNKQSIFVSDYRIFHQDNKVEVFLSLFTKPQQRKHGKLSKNSGVLLSAKNRRLKLEPGILTGLTKATNPKALKSILKAMSTFFGGKKVLFYIAYANQYMTPNRKDSFQLKKDLLSLRRYKRGDFFSEGFSVNYSLSRNVAFVPALAEFVVENMKTVKRLKFFLKFLQKSLSLLVSNPKNSLKGVKIKIRGRIRKGGRAKTFWVTVGNVPCNSYNAKICYKSTSAHNKNGSYGVKLWAIEN